MNAHNDTPPLDNTPPTIQEQEPVSIIIPVIEEHIVIDKQTVETGRVRISKEVKTEQEQINISLQHDEYDVERIAVNRFVDLVPEVRKEGNVTIIPVLKEVMVKRVLLVEEIKITRHTIEHTEHHEVALRKEVVKVSHSEPAENTTDAAG